MKTLIHFTLLMTVFELAYSQSGQLDTTFIPPAGYAIISFISGSATAYNYGKSIIIQPDGKFVFSGYSSSDRIVSKFSVARFNDTVYDTTFGTMGQVTTAIGTTNDFANSAALQIDGSIVVAGSSSNGSNSDFAVVRYNTDGTLDTTFSDDGKVTTPVGAGDDEGTSVAIQKDGKIVVGGFSRVGSYYDFAVVRYNTDGSLDPSFSHDGIVTTAFGSFNDKAYSVVLQVDGKIVLAGYTVNVSNDDIAVARYNTDGSLDSTFSSDGKVTTAVGSSIDHGWSVAIQEDQKIVVAGECYINSTYDFVLVRYNQDGSLDDTFDGDGKVTTPVGLGSDMGYAVTIQPNNKIVVAGYSYVLSTANFAVVRYNSNGSVDTTFSGDGKVTTNVGDGGASSIALQADGKIVIAGTTSYSSLNSYFAILRYTSSDGPVSVPEFELLPSVFSLEQNYPNPFNPSTTINYQLAGRSHVTLKVFDLLGREVATLVNGIKNQGHNSIQFDASRFAAGVYFYQLQAGSFIETKKLVLLR